MRKLEFDHIKERKVKEQEYQESLARFSAELNASIEREKSDRERDLRDKVCRLFFFLLLSHLVILSSQVQIMSNTANDLILSWCLFFFVSQMEESLSNTQEQLESERRERWKEKLESLNVQIDSLVIKLKTISLSLPFLFFPFFLKREGERKKKNVRVCALLHGSYLSHNIVHDFDCFCLFRCILLGFSFLFPVLLQPDISSLQTDADIIRELRNSITTTRNQLEAENSTLLAEFVPPHILLSTLV